MPELNYSTRVDSNEPGSATWLLTRQLKIHALTLWFLHFQIWVKPYPPDLSEPSNLSDHPELRESRSDHPEFSASPIFEGGHLPADKTKSRGRPLFVCFIDFKSAFDLLKRSAFLFKLVNSIIREEMFTVVKKHVWTCQISRKMDWETRGCIWKLERCIKRGRFKSYIL